MSERVPRHDAVLRDGSPVSILYDDKLAPEERTQLARAEGCGVVRKAYICVGAVPAKPRTTAEAQAYALAFGTARKMEERDRLRDQLAGLAMQVFLRDGFNTKEWSWNLGHVASLSYDVADAMLKEKEGRREQA